MEALRAVRLTPLSVLAKRTERGKNWSPAAIPPFKNQSFSIFSNSGCGFSVPKTLHGSLVLLSSVLSSELAKALTYDEALRQSVSSSGSISDFDVNRVLDGFITFASDNPLILGGAVAVLAVPLVVSQLISKPKTWGVESAKAAFANLGDDANAQLLDIRAPADIKKAGSPDIRGLKKKPIAVVYGGEDKPGFLTKLAMKFKEPENTKLFILDKFDGNSELVAELVTANGFKAAYAIKDGAEGSRGWMNSDLPWIVPKKTLSLDLGNLRDALGHTFGVASDAVRLNLSVGAAAAAALGLLAYTEVETILQVLGSAALVQFVSQKLLFAEDRKQTFQQIEEFLDTKVAPKELVGDIQQIRMAFLPSSIASNALPAPADATPVPSIQPKVEAAPEPNLEANSVPKAGVHQEESLPGAPRPLSPYPNYPDYKPASSPMPSQP